MIHGSNQIEQEYDRIWVQSNICFHPCPTSSNLLSISLTTGMRALICWSWCSGSDVLILTPARYPPDRAGCGWIWLMQLERIRTNYFICHSFPIEFQWSWWLVKSNVSEVDKSLLTSHDSIGYWWFPFRSHYFLNLCPMHPHLIQQWSHWTPDRPSSWLMAVAYEPLMSWCFLWADAEPKWFRYK